MMLKATLSPTWGDQSYSVAEIANLNISLKFFIFTGYLLSNHWPVERCCVCRCDFLQALSVISKLSIFFLISAFELKHRQETHNLTSLLRSKTGASPFTVTQMQVLTSHPRISSTFFLSLFLICISSVVLSPQYCAGSLCKM